MTIDAKQLIPVKNMDTGSVGYTSQTYKQRRLWQKPGIIRQIPFEELQDIINNEPGGRELFANGILQVLDKTVRDELNLETFTVDLYSDQDIIEILQSSLVAIEEMLNAMSQDQREKTAYLAIEYDITSLDKAALLQKYTGLKVSSMAQEKDALKISKDTGRSAPPQSVEPVQTATNDETSIPPARRIIRK